MFPRHRKRRCIARYVRERGLLPLGALANVVGVLTGVHVTIAAVAKGPAVSHLGELVAGMADVGTLLTHALRLTRWLALLLSCRDFTGLIRPGRPRRLFLQT